MKSISPGFVVGGIVYGFFAMPLVAMVFEYSTQQFPEIPLNIINTLFSCTGQCLGAVLQM